MGIFAIEFKYWFEGYVTVMVFDPRCLSRRVLRAIFTAAFSRARRLTAEVAPSVAPILLLLRDAADADPAAAALHAELDQNRLARMTQNARHLVRGGHVRKGVSLAHAADVLWTYSSPELFDLLVRRRRWSLERYGRFVADGIAGALL